MSHFGLSPDFRSTLIIDTEKKGIEMSALSNLCLNFLNTSHYQIYHAPVARYFKSIDAAIILSELINRHQYHQSRDELISIDDSGDGWFYHTIEAIEERTAMFRRSQDTAIALLKSHNLIETINYGMPSKRYFKLNMEGFERLSKNLCSLAETYKQGCPGGDPSKHVCPKRTNKDVQNVQTGPYISKNPIEEPNIKIQHAPHADLDSAAKPLREVSISSTSKKAKKEQQDFLPFGQHVRLTQKQHDELIAYMGKSNLESLIVEMNDWIPNNKPFKDYYAALRTWYRRRGQYGGSLKHGSLNVGPVNASEDQVSRNKKLCEIAEERLSSKFTSYVYFQAGPSGAMLINQNKDIKKHFPYDGYTPETLKNILVQELSSCFPGAREILLGSSSQKTDNVIRESIKNFNVQRPHGEDSENRKTPEDKLQ